MWRIPSLNIQPCGLILESGDQQGLYLERIPKSEQRGGLSLEQERGLRGLTLNRLLPTRNEKSGCGGRESPVTSGPCLAQMSA